MNNNVTLNNKPAFKIGWLIVSSCIFAMPMVSLAASVTIDSIRLRVPLATIKELRDEGIVKQAYDYSCGSAALATLLTYGLYDKVSEKDILTQILEPLPKDEESLRKKQGLSLLDLQGVSQARGHKAKGFRITSEYLAKLQRPVIVFIKPQGYEHFAVLKGVRNDRVYLADPSLGNIRMPVYKFLDIWLDANGKGVIFVVERHDGQWADDYLLRAPVTNLPQPEILTIRNMLDVGNPYVRYPHLSR